MTNTTNKNGRQEIKAKFTISMDPGLLRRLDEVAEARKDSRSAVIERIVNNQIEEEEKAVRLLIDNPVIRETIMRLMASPDALELLNRLLGKKIVDRQTIENSASRAQAMCEAGRERSGKRRKSFLETCANSKDTQEAS